MPWSGATAALASVYTDDAVLMTTSGDVTGKQSSSPRCRRPEASR
jgi:hypothetical protein